ncbi:MAG TPA: GMC family oxidoreductase [Steroidobacteraceae bacterium]|jgi:choline dehydrogenase-like flavoprotein|nr:GMC family oxidoreductase [Steroidobacteraceae bacterium]
MDSSHVWDVIVIGTGIGGATVGQALARRGFGVLFVEKGASVIAGGDATDATSPESRLNLGWWPYPVSLRRTDGTCNRFHAPIGCAVGGSSIFYAAALERMERSDFDTLITSTQEVPRWPVSYDELSPYYAEAEALYGIAADADAAAEARFSEWDRELVRAMRRNELHPMPLQVAIRYDEECRECVGRICPRKCKADARTACLDEALRRPGCHLLEGCDVQRLEADDTQVRVVHAKYQGQDVELRARVVVLAAGAMHSPQVLLRSRNAFWPHGLANHSDQVGRNLMFHGIDLYALWAPRRLDRRTRQKKALSVRDFYLKDGRRLGYVQSLGVDAGRGDIALFMKNFLRRMGIRNEMLLRVLVKVPASAVARALGDASILVGMTEDDPSPDNRIVLDEKEPNGASFSYTVADDLRERSDALRENFRRRIKPWRLIRLTPALEMNYGHPCGTCRFGDDPKTSVLNRDCRAHDVANLYVVDSSFMPRSSAVNPSLTIAATALRTAAAIADSLSARSAQKVSSA